MPFIPDKEQEQAVRECRHAEHRPPNMIVWRQHGVWVCPACGVKTRVGPSRIRCAAPRVDAVSNIFVPEQPSKATILC